MMSDFDDLEEININGDKVQDARCGNGRHLARTSPEACRRYYRETVAIRSGPNTPSLPKLKFLEGEK